MLKSNFLFLDAVKVNDTDVDVRIIGGHEATKVYPFMVAFERYNRTVCAGSLVTPSSIVTAAHCLTHTPENTLLRLGSPYLQEGGITRKVSKYIKHPKYTSARPNYDIGVIVMDRPVLYSPVIQPIVLADKEDRLDSEDVVEVTGWGYRVADDRESKPKVVNTVLLNYIPLRICNQLFDHMLDHGMLCAGDEEYTKDACKVSRLFFPPYVCLNRRALQWF